MNNNNINKNMNNNNKNNNNINKNMNNINKNNNSYTLFKNTKNLLDVLYFDDDKIIYYTSTTCVVIDINGENKKEHILNEFDSICHLYDNLVIYSQNNKINSLNVDNGKIEYNYFETGNDRKIIDILVNDNFILLYYEYEYKYDRNIFIFHYTSDVTEDKIKINIYKYINSLYKIHHICFHTDKSGNIILYLCHLGGMPYISGFNNQYMVDKYNILYNTRNLEIAVISNIDYISSYNQYIMLYTYGTVQFYKNLDNYNESKPNNEPLISFYDLLHGIEEKCYMSKYTDKILLKHEYNSKFSIEIHNDYIYNEIKNNHIYNINQYQYEDQDFDIDQYLYQNEENIIWIPYSNLDGQKTFNFEYEYYCDSTHRHVLYMHNIFDNLYTYKSNFKNKVRFTFYNILTQQRDLAIDAGGLSKIVFSELSKYLTSENNYFFELDDETQMYKFKTIQKEKIMEEKINFLGVLFSYALKYNHLIQIKLDPVIVYILFYSYGSFTSLHVDDFINFIKEDSSSISELYPYSCLISSNRCKEEYPMYWTEIPQNINNTNIKYNSNTNTINYSHGTLYGLKKRKLTADDVFHRIRRSIEKQEWIFKYLNIGFNNNNLLLDTFKFRYTLRLFNDLLLGVIEINMTILLEHLKFTDFSYYQIQHIIKIFKYCIEECGDEEKWIRMLLVVMTGINTIPSSGYGNNPLCIQIGEIPKKISVHTCSNQMDIDKSYFNNLSEEEKDSNLYGLFKYENLRELREDTSNA